MGANAPPTPLTKLRKRGRISVALGVARWSHLEGYNSCFSDFSLSGSGFPILAPEFDETAFDL